MTFGLSFVPLVLLAGASVDLSRAVNERAQLHHAVDAAALAAGKEMKTKTIQELAVIATNNLTASQNSPVYSLAGNPTLNADKTELCINAQTAMPTTFMKLANINTVALNAEACVKVGGTTYEVAMVLDNTGSMATGDKIGSLKTASKNLIDTLLPGTAASSYVKMSLVPFNYSVKAVDPDSIAQSSNADESTRYNNVPWIDTAGQSSIHWENFPQVAGGAFTPASRFELFKNLGVKWTGCFEERPGAYALGDQAPSSTTPDTLYVPQFAPDEGDSASGSFNDYLSDYGNSICAAGDVYAQRDALTPYFHDGQSKLCKYKAGTKTVTTTTPGACTTTQETYTYTTTEKQKVCTTNKKGKEKCNWEDVDVTKTGTRDVQTCEPDIVTTTQVALTLSPTTSSNRGPNRNCTIQPVQPLTNDKTALKAQIDTMVASGNTNIISGLMWGWRTVSPNGPYGSASSYSKPNNKKVIVLMTDGTNTWGTSGSNPNVSDYSPFGFFWNNRLGADVVLGNVRSSNVRSYMDAKVLQACTAAKAAGVLIYTVGFSVSGDEIDSQGLALLQSCASKPANYYVATNAAGLNAAFQDIGNSINGLHLSQ